MRILNPFIGWAYIASLWCSYTWLAAYAKVTPFLPQSFLFDWNPQGQPVPIPVTAQCDTINITWSRQSATGPNPVAPYFLQIYTSTSTYPFIVPAGSQLNFNWAVPFAPYTLYQICMFDKNGNTGGCQAVYTVIPPLNTTSPPSCTNVTTPSQLGVNAVVDNGPLSEYGWIDQCTDISVTPTNGTPPYTFTIAPALHPPYNITSNSTSIANWTVSLTWASPFFISVADSVGNLWANGPLHSGGNGPTSCLTGAVDSSSKKKVPAATIGAGVGGVVVGLGCGIVAAFFIMRRQRNQAEGDQFMHLSPGSNMGSPRPVGFDRALSGASSHYRAVPSTAPSGQLIDVAVTPAPGLTRPAQYQIEPFVMPGEVGRTAHTATPSVAEASAGPDDSQAQSQSSGSQPRQNQVYVVHHDGGRAPVTVYHQDGTQVVELPPRYNEGSSVSGSEMRSDGRSEGPSDSRSDGRSDTGRSEALTDGPGFLRRTRQPNTPRKGTSPAPPSSPP